LFKTLEFSEHSIKFILRRIVHQKKIQLKINCKFFEISKRRRRRQFLRLKAFERRRKKKSVLKTKIQFLFLFPNRFRVPIKSAKTTRRAKLAKMEVDDVVDLSLGSGRDPALTITPTTPREIRALTQNSSLTITPAPGPPPPSTSGGGSSSKEARETRESRDSRDSSSKNSNRNQTSSSSAASASASSASGANANASNNSNSNNADNEENKVQRRVLRPRTEPKSYAEAPDIVLLPARMNGRQQNGNIDSETDDEEMPPYVPIKELTPAELKERENGLRKLREDLRTEETKLILLKKLKQSQHVMKENLVVTQTSVSPTNPLAAIPASLTSKGALSVTPTSALPLNSHTKCRQPAVSIR